MSSQSPFKSTHTKVLEVLRSKQSKKSTKDPRQSLYFKIKPEKAVNELIIPYKDLKDNFPYALIDYYESRALTKTDKQAESEQLLSESDRNFVKFGTIIPEETSSRKDKKNQAITQKDPHKQQKIVLQKSESHKLEEGMQLMYDYDKLLKESERSTKIHHSIFSQFEPVQNRYLKDLNNDDTTQYGRRGFNGYNYETKRKKAKVNYTEED